MLRSRGFWPASLAWSVGPRSQWETLPQKQKGRRLQKKMTLEVISGLHTHMHTQWHTCTYMEELIKCEAERILHICLWVPSIVLRAVFGVGQCCLIRYLQVRKRYGDWHFQKRLGHCPDRDHSSHWGTRSQRGLFGNEDQKVLSCYKWCMIILLADLLTRVCSWWLARSITHKFGDQIRFRDWKNRDDKIQTHLCYRKNSKV